MLVKRVIDGRTILPLKDGGLSPFHPSSTGNIAALAVHSLGLTSSQVLNAADSDPADQLDYPAEDTTGKGYPIGRVAAAGYPSDALLLERVAGEWCELMNVMAAS